MCVCVCLRVLCVTNGRSAFQLFPVRGYHCKVPTHHISLVQFPRPPIFIQVKGSGYMCVLPKANITICSDRDLNLSRCVAY